jgi:serine/threonine protein kinase
MVDQLRCFTRGESGSPKPLLIGRKLGYGALGDVYALLGAGRGYAVKIYKGNPKRGLSSQAVANANESKVDWLIRIGLPLAANVYGGKDYPQLAWPANKVYDEKGHFCGFTMPEIDLSNAADLGEIMIERDRDAAHIPNHFHFRLHTARNLAFLFHRLHASGVCMIDLKPDNIKFYRDAGFVCLIDCDSFISSDRSQPHEGAFFTDLYMLPEAAANGVNAAEYREEQDRFALAVVIFQMLNEGIHPFDGLHVNPANAASGSDIQKQINAGLYPCGLVPHPDFSPRPQSRHEWFDDATRRFFDRAFTPGGVRPSAKEWADHLAGYVDVKTAKLFKCKKRPDKHVHFDKGCFLCAWDDYKAKVRAKQKADWPRPADTPPNRPRMQQAAWTPPARAPLTPRPPNSKPATPHPIAPWSSLQSAVVQRKAFSVATVLLCVLGVVGYLVSKISEPIPTSPSTPSGNRYSLSEGGILTELATGRMLTSLPVAYKKTHAEAIDVCRNLNLEGYTGWVLPTQAAVLSLDRTITQIGFSSLVDFFGGPNNCGPGQPATNIWLSRSEDGRGLSFECNTLRTSYNSPNLVGAVICARSDRAPVIDERAVTYVPERALWVAIGKEVNVRAGPGLKYSVTSTERGGAAMVTNAIANDEDGRVWHQVRLSDGRRGFVAGWVATKALIDFDPSAKVEAQYREWLKEGLSKEVALAYAIAADRVDVAEFAILQGADVNVSDLTELGQPIFGALSVEMLEMLLSRGANLNSYSSRGGSLLHETARRDPSELELVKFLLARNVSPVERDQEGRTALDLAKKSRDEASEYLRHQENKQYWADELREKDAIVALLAASAFSTGRSEANSVQELTESRRGEFIGTDGCMYNIYGAHVMGYTQACDNKAKARASQESPR